MLEKIGLPPKPSLRGNNWVADASHCQGCSSQFTFINRKHHCRRCGGLFCNSCTQQRMVLRGQGDSPVRICEPCKKLEEAARFEMRYGHKNRAGKGGSKLASKHEEVLNQILGKEVKDSVSSARELTMDMLSGDHQTTGDASCSNTGEVLPKDKGNIPGSQSLDQHNLTDTESTSPEELRQQAIEEKKKYKTLKAEGKSEEALKAFKRGKELERQAGALELYLRKNRKKALASGKDDYGTSSGRDKISPSKSEGKDDLASELRELGWSDMDLRNAEKRPPTLSLESELSTIMGEVSQKTNSANKTQGSDKSQVIAHKKKALELKRAGNLAEAKEELKKAKVLERQIEEQELLGEAEDSDEELSSLIRGIDDVKDDVVAVGYNPNSTFDFDNLLGSADLGVDGNFDVTDEDMDDPEIAAALKSLGWTEESTQLEETDRQSAFISKEELMDEIRSLKREALNQKRAGNPAEAMSLLKKAKVLEKDLGSSDTLGDPLTGHSSVILQKEPRSRLVDQINHGETDAENVGETDAENVDEIKDNGPKMKPKSKMMIQKELLGLKKRALALRREGKLDEAEEELKKGKDLEKQLEEMDKAPKSMQSGGGQKLVVNPTITDVGDEGEVTDQDMHDPAYLSLLQNLGWKDDDKSLSSTSKEVESPAHVSDFSGIRVTAATSTSVPKKSKGEIQRELLGLKRKSLALRRQGQVEEAEEVLKMASSLEAQLAEIETPHQIEFSAEPQSVITGNINIDSSLQDSTFPVGSSPEKRDVKEKGSTEKMLQENVKEPEIAVDNIRTTASNPIEETVDQNLQQEILAHKRKAVVLKREGKLAEAKEELRQAKLLERHVEEKSHSSTSSPDVIESKVSSIARKGESSNVGKKPLSARDRFKLQQESLGHKRQALKLRREGRSEEADAELELAKALEAQLEEITGHDSSSGNVAEQTDGVSVEDFLDPELLSALKAIGIQETSSGSQGVQGPMSNKSVDSKADSSSEERMQLEERIKAEKVKAVNLKRSGRQAEAMDALRRAKLYEKKLNSLAS